MTAFRTLHYTIDGEARSFTEHYPYSVNDIVEANGDRFYSFNTSDGEHFYASTGQGIAFHRTDGPALYSNEEVAPNKYYEFDGKFWVRWFLKNEDHTQEILNWISAKNLPYWEEWTTQEKILFKMKFL